MTPLDARNAKTMDGGGNSFGLRSRMWRAAWILTWAILASWTPPPMHRWRCFLLRLFGAKIGRGVRVYSSARIWNPATLSMADLSWIGPRVICYNQGMITIGFKAVVSQGSHLCASTHDISDPFNQLILRPIYIDKSAWIAADAFVGPGVTVGEGAVLGARGVAMQDLEPWKVYSGNPARAIKRRVLRLDS